MKKIFFLITLLSLSNCGFLYGITTGSKKNTKISFSTIPSGAEIIISGENKGKTPLVLELPSGLDYDGKITKQGYVSQDFALESKFRKSVWCMADIVGYFLIVPLFSVYSDYCSILNPEDVAVSLSKDIR